MSNNESRPALTFHPLSPKEIEAGHSAWRESDENDKWQWSLDPGVGIHWECRALGAERKRDTTGPDHVTVGEPLTVNVPFEWVSVNNWRAAEISRVEREAEFMVAELTRERDALLARLRVVVGETSNGQHDYHGPTRTNEDGTKEAIPDVVHERFHQSVGDILAGKIMPKAREQMADALRRSPPVDPTTASTSRPFPVSRWLVGDDPRRIGSRVGPG